VKGTVWPKVECHSKFQMYRKESLFDDDDDPGDDHGLVDHKS